MNDPKALSAEPNEYHAGNGRIAYVRQTPDHGAGLFAFYARPALRPDLIGRRIRAITTAGVPFYTDYHEAQEDLAKYAKRRGWKAVKE